MTLFLLAALLAQSTGGARPAADPAGEWRFEGACPAAHIRYRGQLTVAGSGPYYTLVWSAGGQMLRGTGLIDRDHMAVEFHAEGARGGLMHMRRQSGQWRGRWAYEGDNEACTETWTRPARP